MAAGLNNTNADALAAAIATALNITDTASKAVLQSTWRLVYAHLKTDIQVTIAATSITTNGSATTQSGPPAPINISPN